MPIMKPEHQQAMRNAQKALADLGLEGAKPPAAEGASAKEILDRVGLSLEETLTELAMVAKGGNEGLRARALDTVLKIHGVLKEAAQGPAAPSFTINIVNGETAATNPALDLKLPEGVNPIFVPRQLLTQLQEKTTN
jgi:hypothetical protein